MNEDQIQAVAEAISLHFHHSLKNKVRTARYADLVREAVTPAPPVSAPVDVETDADGD